MRPALVCGWVRNPSSSSAAISLRIVALETPRPELLCDRLGADGLPRADVLLDDRVQDRGLPRTELVALLHHGPMLLALSSVEC